MSDVVLEIPFTGGIDQSTREEVVDPTASFTNVYNVRKNKQGSGEKRSGFATLGNTRFDGSTRTTGCRLAMNSNQVCTIDNSGQLDALSEAAGRFVLRQRLPEATYSLFEMPSLGITSFVSDVVSVGGYTITAFTVLSGGLGTTIYGYTTIVDTKTGAVIRGPDKLDSSTSVDDIRLVTYGAYAVFIFGDKTASEIRAYYIDTTSPATLNTGWVATTPAKLATDFSGGSLTAASLPGLNDRFAIAYGINAGVNRVCVKTFTIAAAIDSITINTGSVLPTTTGGIDISDGTTGTLWVGWNENLNAKMCGLQANNLGITLASTLLVSSVGNTILSVNVTSRGTTNGAIWIQLGDTGVSQSVKTVTGATTLDGTESGFANAIIQSSPFLRNGRLYAFFSSLNGDDVTLCDWTPIPLASPLIPYLRPVVAPIVRGLYGGTRRPRSRMASSGASTYSTGLVVKRTGTTLGTIGVAIDFASMDRWSNVEHRNSLYLSGGITSIFDGTTAFESGFVCAPPAPTVSTAVAGGTTLTQGGRTYVAVYAHADADGNLHLSGVSNPSPSTGNIAAKRIDVTVYPNAITSRDGGLGSILGTPLKIMLFATNDGGTTYHLIDVKANNPGGSVLTLTDANSELSITSGALLYGSGNLPGTVVNGQIGGPQDHRSPPGLSFLTSFNGTLVGASNNEVWQSSQAVYGEGIWWSPIFSAQFNEVITGLATLGDGTLVVFTRKRIYVLSGEPPNDAGTAGGLGVPRVLPVDVGCANARSIVVTSLGIFFLSDRTYELFSGGASLIPIGFQVQDELDAFPIVTSAVVDTVNALVRISLAQALDVNGLVTGTGRDLIFDLQLQTWITVDRKHGTTDDQASQDAAMIRYNTGAADEWRYGWIGADGVVWGERGDADASRCLDGATWITQSATTSWIHVSGIQGEQFVDRILFLAKQVTNHDFTIELAFDYGAFANSKTFTAAQINTLAREWLDREVVQTTGQAIRIRITDVTPSTGVIGTGQGAIWVAFTVSGQPHRGAKRTSGPQRGGSP